VGVLLVVEPFWTSSYKQVDKVKHRDPPFFLKSSSYFYFMSSLCRFLIEKSQNNNSPWKLLFKACRTAIRTPAGLSVTEFLAPLLILETFCFSSESVLDPFSPKATIINEFLDILLFDKSKRYTSISNEEHLKACNAIFTVLDTISLWSEKHIEEQYKVTRRGRTFTSPRNSLWPFNESIAIKISEFTEGIPLKVCAKAASELGMHARALRYLELELRSRVVNRIYDDNYVGITPSGPGGSLAELSGVDLGILQKMLGELNEIDAMSAVPLSSDSFDLMGDVYEKEMHGDWAMAYTRYEQAIQVQTNHSSDWCEHDYLQLENSKIRVLLASNQLSSVLNQVDGLLSTQDTNFKLGSTEECNDARGSSPTAHRLFMPYAVEAAWRLGQWARLDNLCNEKIQNAYKYYDLDGQYRVCIGRAMLALKSKSCSKETFRVSIDEARLAVMTTLSNTSRESYTRSYPYLLRLHVIREIECASKSILALGVEDGDLDKTKIQKLANQESSDGWDWAYRLSMAAPDVVGISSIINARLALAHLACNSSIEGEMLLNLGKISRKQGALQIAETSLLRAKYLFFQSTCPLLENKKFDVQMQLAKLKFALGDCTAALRMIEPDGLILENMLLKSEKELNCFQNDGKRILQATEWMVHSGWKCDRKVIRQRFEISKRILQNCEKAHFSYAKYLQSLLEAHLASLIDTVRLDAIARDEVCHAYILEAMTEYGKALQLSQKHLYQAMPRLLSIWFEFSSAKSSESLLQESQLEANELMFLLIEKIQPCSFYTTIPQLISHINHSHKQTSTIVKSIIKRVLEKYPKQAMWAVAWLRHSACPKRSSLGEEIFKSTAKKFQRKENMKVHDLLMDSKSLFRYLIDLAKHQPKNPLSKSFDVKLWRGSRPLHDFIPPIQAALSVSHSSVEANNSSNDIFPKYVPRIRAFSKTIQVMSSKARPKRVTAFAIQPDTSTMCSQSTSFSSSLEDVGEMHFLLKQEAKGDLRKDARVQDLNNVINRLLARSSNASQQRRLHLRTFSVVCLSEDCGIIEWVPNTDSLRNIVTSAYNPQAPADAQRRRGAELTNFTYLRDTYEKCQNVYFKRGNLKKAAAMFETLCLQKYPPLLYWWFVMHFRNPHAWFEARTRFTLSASVWSAVGHIIGLGDRHSENILINTASGECVHVDFDCIFDKGLNLPRPEVIPFRLTTNIIDAFGPTGTEGTFKGSLTSTMFLLRKNCDTLLSVLQPFVEDPVIDWKRQKSRQDKGSSTLLGDFASAQRSIKVIEERLRGIYNLRNPKLKRSKEDDGSDLPLSVDGQVDRMIAEATSNENLVQLYVGWMPWV